MSIEAGKLYKSSAGLKIRIYATDAGGECPIHGAAWDDGHWETAEWTEDGRYYVDGDEHSYDIVDYWPEQPEQKPAGISSAAALIMQQEDDYIRSVIYGGTQSIQSYHPLYIDKPRKYEDE